ncbi:MAG: hypothetical protein U5R49_07155 [Deltaproteobacteria bacterium]|nr:hypothetical protein [Deltaproteobacteria bacterium]
MMGKIKVEYSFEKNVEIVNKMSEDVKRYEQSFLSQMRPAMQEIEKRKSRAQEKAAHIRISLFVHKPDEAE